MKNEDFLKFLVFFFLGNFDVCVYVEDFEISFFNIDFYFFILVIFNGIYV